MPLVGIWMIFLVMRSTSDNRINVTRKNEYLQQFEYPLECPLVRKHPQEAADEGETGGGRRMRRRRHHRYFLDAF